MEYYNPQEKNDYQVKPSSSTSTMMNLVKIYLFFALGLLVTAAMTFGFPYALASIFGTPEQFADAYVTSIIVFCVLSFIFSLGNSIAVIYKKAVLVGIFYFGYAICLGGLCSSLALVLDTMILAMAFVTTGGVFAVCGVVAAFSKGRFNKWMGGATALLLGLVILSIFNFFMKSTLVEWVYTIGVLLVFTLVTIIDMSRIQQNAATKGFENENALALYEAYCLYADFVVIFINILRIFLLTRKD